MLGTGSVLEATLRRSRGDRILPSGRIEEGPLRRYRSDTHRCRVPTRHLWVLGKAAGGAAIYGVESDNAPNATALRLGFPETGTYSNKNRETIAEKRAITMRD